MVANTQKVITTLASLIIDVIEVARGGAKIGNLGKIISISSELKTLLAAAPETFPEMKTFTETDMIQVGQSSYDAIVKVMDFLRKEGLIK